MDNTLQTKFSINRSSYIMQPQDKPVSKKEVAADKTVDGKTGKILFATLGGLAVLGGVAVWVKTKNSKAILNNSLEDKIAEKINLKNTIKQEYLLKKQELLAELPDAETIKDLRVQIKEAEQTIEPEKARLIAYRNKQMGVLRKKMTDLQSDEQWVELRKLRKNLIKVLKGKPSKDEMFIAQNKISLINDLLLTKTYPESEVQTFRKFNRMEPDEAFEFVHRPFSTKDEFKQAYKDAWTVNYNDIVLLERAFNHNEPLMLENLFPDEIASYVACNQKIKKLDRNLNSMKNIVQNYYQTLTALASEFRLSENVRKLNA